jgi:hypothetical protein
MYVSVSRTVLCYNFLQCHILLHCSPLQLHVLFSQTGIPINFIFHHHHKHPGLGHLVRSVSRVTVALSIVFSVSQLFSFFVGCSEMILKGFGFVAFFPGVKASSFCIYLSCLICFLSVVRGEWNHLFCGYKGRNLPEVSITAFLPPQFFVSLTLSKSNFLTHTKCRQN